jgi:hypoxanthine phosphoribosyltransferase
MKCRILTFEEIYELSRQLANKVKDSNYLPTTIVALARGGWVPARLLCDFMGVTDLISLKVEHWLETGRTKDEATVRYPLNTELNGKRLLLVDDVADTGKSLIAATDYLSRLADSMKAATMQYFPSSNSLRPTRIKSENGLGSSILNWIEDQAPNIRLMETDKKNSISQDE